MALRSYRLALVVLTVASLPAWAQAPAAPGPPVTPVPTSDTAAVRLDGVEVFHVSGFMGVLSAEDRAGLAERKIKLLADDPFYSPELFSGNTANGATQIVYGEHVVGVVTPEDVAFEHATSDQIAAERLVAIKRAISHHREQQRPQQVTRAIVAVLLATSLLALVFWALKRLERWAERRVEASRTGGIALALERYLSLDASQVAGLERTIVRYLRIATQIVVAIVYLQVVFTFVPFTRGYALAVLGYVIDPLKALYDGFLASVGNLFTIGVLLVVLRFLLKALRWIFDGIASGRIRIPGLVPEWASPLYKLIRVAVIALGIVMIYPYVPGSDTAAFKGVSLFAGALFTLGASGTVGNFVGGLAAIFASAFRIGDVVKIGDVLGVVEETTLVLTRLRTPHNEIVSVPNSSILSGQVVNYSTRARADGVVVHTEVTIGYDAPWRTVHELLLTAALRTPEIESDPAPFVLQTKLDDFYVHYEINAYTHRPIRLPWIYDDLHRNIQDAFNEAGVEIMSPHFASLRDGNTIAIPESARPEGYRKPRFGVAVDRATDEPPAP